jgi:hypothetical protein
VVGDFRGLSPLGQPYGVDGMKPLLHCSSCYNDWKGGFERAFPLVMFCSRKIVFVHFWEAILGHLHV